MDADKIKRIVETVEEVKRKSQPPPKPVLYVKPLSNLSGYFDSWWMPLALSLISGLTIYVVVLVSVQG